MQILDPSPPDARKRILIVEDEPAIADTLVYALSSEGYHPEHVTLARDALMRLRTEQFALVILDVGLPDGNGFELCRELRRFSDVPVIFLTARHDEIDRVVGLEIGADDYVTKPFSPREVAARVRVILRRVRPEPNHAANLFSVDERAGRIAFCGQILELTRYEYLLLKLLIENPERIFSREQLLDKIWTEPEAVFDRTVDTHVKTLRAKLRSVAPELDPIRTHRGLGYCLHPLQ